MKKGMRWGWSLGWSDASLMPIRTQLYKENEAYCTTECAVFEYIAHLVVHLLEILFILLCIFVSLHKIIYQGNENTLSEI